MNKDNCDWQWTTENGVDGYKVTSKHNGNSIFLPATGYRDGTSLYGSGSDGIYWSSSPIPYYGDYAYFMYFSGFYDWKYSYRYNGFSIRPVTD